MPTEGVTTSFKLAVNKASENFFVLEREVCLDSSVATTLETSQTFARNIETLTSYFNFVFGSMTLCLLNCKFFLKILTNFFTYQIEMFSLGFGLAHEKTLKTITSMET